MFASRNLRLCTKDCICLFVCPTGATDTESGQIDASKCLDGCRLCVDACPGGAIHLVPGNYPKPQPKREDVVEALFDLAESKVKTRALAGALGEDHRLARKALDFSLEVLAEDCVREAGYMLPQSAVTKEFLKNLKERYGSDPAFPVEAVERLLDLL
ncbi:MAG: 4Fe-4S ferredoxin [Spirochaetales bacterium]|nr:4Fe-4S ferredoxin [Spirochaetales bacterium]